MSLAVFVRKSELHTMRFLPHHYATIWLGAYFAVYRSWWRYIFRKGGGMKKRDGVLLFSLTFFIAAFFISGTSLGVNDRDKASLDRQRTEARLNDYSPDQSGYRGDAGYNASSGRAEKSKSNVDLSRGMQKERKEFFRDK
jgi:hypothetical protein